MPTGIELITAERTRQVQEEGWTAEHDDQYTSREFIKAAKCYEESLDSSAPQPSRWPWAAEWWKPADRIRNLVKAGALYMAERDRCNRAKLIDKAVRCDLKAQQLAELIDQLQQPTEVVK